MTWSEGAYGCIGACTTQEALPGKNLPGLGLFFADARLPVLNFFPDLGPQRPGFEVQTLRHIQEAPRAQRLLAQSASSVQLWCLLVLRKPTRTALLAPLIGQEG